MSVIVEERLSKLIPLIRWFLVGAFGLGVWVSTLEFRQRQLDQVPLIIAELREWRVATDASQYTIREANDLQRTFVELINNQDKRLTRMEDSQVMVSEILDRLNNK